MLIAFWNNIKNILMTVIEHEISKFTKQAEEWWDMNGSFKLLHEINPIRLQYILRQISEFYNLGSNPNINKLRILDVGCGGGILSIPLARLNAEVVAIDAGSENIKIAQAKALEEELTISFQSCKIEDFVSGNKESFDVVICLEVLEHVEDPEIFISYLTQAIKKGGLVILSTINRTLKAKLLAIGAAEYILNMVPKGTHEYKKFIKPSELHHYSAAHKLQIIDLKGMVFDLKSRDWQLSDDIDINYFASFKKT